MHAVVAPDADRMVEIKFKVSASERDQLDLRQRAAGYKSRARLLVDSGLSSPLPALESLSEQIGHLGLQADLLVRGEGRRELSRRQAREVGSSLVVLIIDLMTHLRSLP